MRPGREPPSGRGSRRAATAALAVLLAVTAAWWALALWPAGEVPPAWLGTVREVCFGSAGEGLPGPEGWAALLGQPLLLGLVLAAGWGRELREGWARARGSRSGRAGLALAGLLAATAVAAVLLRVGSLREAAAAGAPPPAPARGATATAQAAPSDPSGAVTRPGVAAFAVLEEGVPPLSLIDRRGEPFSLGALGRRVALVTFAYGDCETVCPALVRETVEAARRLRVGGVDAAAVVVTLDPWRDAPSRLPHLAARWGLAPADRLLGGSVEAVERTLDVWRVTRSRDPTTGDLAHARQVVVVAPGGAPAFVTSGGVELLVRLGRRAAAGAPPRSAPPFLPEDPSPGP